MPISPLPSPPSRANPVDFASKGDAFMAALPTFVTETNALATELNTASDAAVTASGLSASSAEVAAAASAVASSIANYKGLWSSLTGALTIPASVYHNSKFWMLLENTTSVQTNQPGVSSIWAPTVTETELVGDIKVTNATPDPTKWIKCNNVYNKSGYSQLATLLGDNYIDQDDYFGGSITAAISNGTTVVVLGSKGVFTSTDSGETWTLSLSLDIATNTNIIHNGTQFVFVKGGFFFYSTDGLSWTNSFIHANLSTSVQGMRVAFGAGKYVVHAVSLGEVYEGSSLTGTFTLRSVSGLASVTSLSFINNLFVLTGQNASGGVWTSTDGITWTQRNTGTSLVSKIIHSGSLYVIIDAGAIKTSPDLTTWTARTLTNLSQANDVVFANSLFVVAGGASAVTGNKIWTSTDGTTWTQRTTPSVFSNSNHRLFYVNNRWFARSEYNLITSTDATTWVVSHTVNPPRFILYSGSNYVKISEYESFFTGTDAINFTLKYGGYFLVAVQGNGTQRCFSDGTTTLVATCGGFKPMYTTNGNTWTTASVTVVDSSVQFIGKFASTWVITYGDGSMYTSTDLVTWTQQDVAVGAVTRSFIAANTNNTLFVAACGSTIRYASSLTGTWTSVAHPDGSGATFVAFMDNRFVLRSNDGNYWLESTDAITWRRINFNTARSSFYQNGNFLVTFGNSINSFWQLRNNTAVQYFSQATIYDIIKEGSTIVIQCQPTFSTVTYAVNILYVSTDNGNTYKPVTFNQIDRDTYSPSGLSYSNGKFYAFFTNSLTSLFSGLLGISTNGVDWIFYETKPNTGVTKVLDIGANNLVLNNRSKPFFSTTKFATPVNNTLSGTTYIKAA